VRLAHVAWVFCLAMSDPFFGIRLKLKRAFEQLDGFENEIAAFLDSAPYRPTVQFKRVPGNTRPQFIFEFVIQIAVDKQCPPMWSIQIGEIVHNLRSSLDHVVYSLVVHATGSPPGKRERTQFPIFKHPPEGTFSKLSMLKGVSQDAASLIKTFQPFDTGEKERSPLWHLNRLSNFDKHNMIHLTGGTIEAHNFSFPTLEAAAYIERGIRKRGAFEHNTPVAWGRIFSDQPPFGVRALKVKAEISFDVIFDDRSSPASGEWSVIRTLRDGGNRVTTILTKLGREIFKIDPCLPEVSE
jgi:hypothetical protein